MAGRVLVSGSRMNEVPKGGTKETDPIGSASLIYYLSIRVLPFIDSDLIHVEGTAYHDVLLETCCSDIVCIAHVI